MNDVMRGAVAGLFGTAAMSATMALDRVLGWMNGEPPPRKIARRAEEAVGLREHLSGPAFEVSWIVQHFAYGAVAGIGYELARRRVRLSEPLPAGPLYGAALWAVSYVGWVPLTGLYPPPTSDRKERLVMTALHHLVYGTALAAASRALRP